MITYEVGLLMIMRRRGMPCQGFFGSRGRGGVGIKRIHVYLFILVFNNFYLFEVISTVNNNNWNGIGIYFFHT